MKKLFITLVAIILLLTSLSGCTNNGDMPKKELPDYPVPSKTTGYTVSGTVRDKAGNALPSVALYIGDEVRALTDANGNYTITSLSGSVKIKPNFCDYTFDVKETSVSGETTQNFVGSNKYTVSVAYQTPNGAMLYGLPAVVNGKAYAATESGVVYVDNNNGKVTVYPQSALFDFSPASSDVYTGGSVVFTATPKKNTFSVSGTIDISSLKKDESMPAVYIAVNGKKYCDVITSYAYDDNGNMSTVVKYTVYGLDSASKTGYKITLIDGEGNPSRESYTVSQAQTNLNFKLQLTRKINLFLESAYPSDPDKVIGQYDFDYRVSICDADGTEVRGSWESSQLCEGITVWEDAVVWVRGSYKTAGGVRMAYEERLKITASMMRSIDNEFEVTYYPYVYVSED